jgi:hypothetical protein
MKKSKLIQQKNKMKYKKKPVVIEAFQMTKDRRADNSEWPEWLHEAWQKEPGEDGSLSCVDGTDQLQIRTLEGMHLVGWGDYIIQGVEGELYSCKPRLFKATYDPVYELSCAEDWPTAPDRIRTEREVQS